MSTARQRAAAYIEATTAAGNSIHLHRAPFGNGSDGILTTFYVGPKHELAATTAALAEAFDRDRKLDRKALAAELIRRGLVQ